MRRSGSIALPWSLGELPMATWWARQARCPRWDQSQQFDDVRVTSAFPPRRDSGCRRASDLCRNRTLSNATIVASGPTVNEFTSARFANSAAAGSPNASGFSFEGPKVGHQPNIQIRLLGTQGADGGPVRQSLSAVIGIDPTRHPTAKCIMVTPPEA